ncbi:hypothetical protein AAKU55_004967 [Oxalobacteraceae bacterium GrIS 1.11]
MKKLAWVAALCGALLAPGALAWGGDGHRAVGAIAAQLIEGRRAQTEVAALLLPGESLASLANWLDCVKGVLCGPQTAEMLAYVAANPKHGQYHYTDIPFQNARYKDGAVGSADDDIVQTLKQAIAVLQGRDDALSNPHGFSRRQALILLTHLVGDIHQPLHVGAAYLGKDGAYLAPTAPGQIDYFDARGGNNLLLDDVKLGAAAARLIPTLPPAPPATGEQAGAPRLDTRSFHLYWDVTAVDYVLRRAGARTPEQFARLAIAAKPAVAMNTGAAIDWPYQWADDALQAARLAYADTVPGPASLQTSKKGDTYRVWALQVAPDYPLPSSALARLQLIKGGYHLAWLLQAIWP